VISGLGMDLIEIERIERAQARSNGRFAERILCPEERALARSSEISFLAGRFAAKEAAVKALGTGLRGGIGWHDLVVLSRANGEPVIEFRGKARDALLKRTGEVVHVTITHSRTYAAAVVVLESATDKRYNCDGED
jgi:holo-[acyl-carrier protein] synthase